MAGMASQETFKERIRTATFHARVAFIPVLIISAYRGFFAYRSILFHRSISPIQHPILEKIITGILVAATGCWIYFEISLKKLKEHRNSPQNGELG
jgi:hypothetical protein